MEQGWIDLPILSLDYSLADAYALYAFAKDKLAQDDLSPKYRERLEKALIVSQNYLNSHLDSLVIVT